MKIVASIEARMTSSRLPGKVLMEAGGKPMLQHLIERLRKVPSIHEIVLATTVNKTDDILEKFAKEQGVACYRGSEEDVMSRVVEAADSVKADIVVEITGDCPIIDPRIIEQTIQMFLNHSADYVSNSVIRSYPDGMDCQVYKLSTLKKSLLMTDDPLHREHVTMHIIFNPEMFSKITLIAPPHLHWPELGLTLDEPKDYELLRNIIEHFSAQGMPYFGCREVIDLLREEHPEWIGINQGVHRKGFT
jgi:spore coat polysaccharide biosynthesis protein SpsF